MSIRSKAAELEAAEQARREREAEAERQRRLEVASEAGYRWAKGTDPVLPPFDCPTCGGSVTLSGVERHIEWHRQLVTAADLRAIAAAITYEP